MAVERPKTIAKWIRILEDSGVDQTALELLAALIVYGNQNLNLAIARTEGTVSTKNSSTALLGTSGVFTGTKEEVKDYKTVGVTVIASHASTEDGLSLEFSTDGTNWDIKKTYTVEPEISQFIVVPVEARYFRLVYTNRIGPQTYFRLQTIFHASEILPEEVTISASRSLVVTTEGEPEMGGVKYMAVRDGLMQGIMENVLSELKIMNTHLSEITDLEVE